MKINWREVHQCFKIPNNKVRLQNRFQLFLDKGKRLIVDDCSLELTITTVQKYSSAVIIKYSPSPGQFF